MRNNKYFWTSAVIYMNYFVLGVGIIILTQNIDYFAETWGTDAAGVMSVVAASGIGKVLVVAFSGILSDKIGRKPVIYIGLIGHILFFGGLLFCQNLTLAYILSFIAGASASFFDGASYPAIFEIYPEQSSIASVLMKGFMSLPGIAFPLLIAYINMYDLWIGWTLVLPLIVALANAVFLIKLRFPDQDLKEMNQGTQKKAASTSIEETEFVNEPKYKYEGIYLIMFSFFVMSSYYLFQQVIHIYGAEVAGMNEVASRALLTYYTVGSIVAVLLTMVIMARGIKDMAVLIVYTFISAIALFAMYIFPTPIVLSVGAFVVGYAASGGILQIGSAMLSRFFPKTKGKNASFYNVAYSIPYYVMPVIAGYLMRKDFSLVMLFDAFLGLATFILMVLLAKRYSKVFGEKIFTIERQVQKVDKKAM